MHQHLEALLPRLADTKFNETAQKFANGFKDSLIKHRSGQDI
jgi:hypothetical protein